MPPPSASSAPSDDRTSVVARVRVVLDAFGFDDDGLGLSELARRTGLPKPTVHRLCTDLVRVGLLERDGACYQLGSALFELGQRVPRARVWREAAMPFMEDLFVATGETVHFGIPDGTNVFYVEKIMGHRG